MSSAVYCGQLLTRRSWRSTSFLPLRYKKHQHYRSPHKEESRKINLETITLRWILLNLWKMIAKSYEVKQAYKVIPGPFNTNLMTQLSASTHDGISQFPFLSSSCIHEQYCYCCCNPYFFNFTSRCLYISDFHASELKNGKSWVMLMLSIVILLAVPKFRIMALGITIIQSC